MMDRMPFWVNLGVGAPAREPSPRNNGVSSHFDSCAASCIVKGRTRTVTEIDEALEELAIVSSERLANWSWSSRGSSKQAEASQLD